MTNAAGARSPDSLQERLTRQFYEWELWGRGWRVWSEPVGLEPPFHPFFGHFVSAEATQPTDDGRKPTWLSSLSDRLLAWTGGQNAAQSATPESSEETEDREPYLFTDDGPATELQVVLPPDTKVSKDAAEQFLLGLGHVSRPLAFEIVATCESIHIQIVCGQSDRSHVRGTTPGLLPRGSPG